LLALRFLTPFLLLQQADLEKERVVSQKEAKECATNMGLPYVETSAKQVSRGGKKNKKTPKCV
jgi:hypothetical protein